MNRLFIKFFLGFWLAALLLAGILLFAQRLLGHTELESARERLLSHAETAAVLWQEGEHRLLRHWLENLRRDERMALALVRGDGTPVPGPHLSPPMRRLLPLPPGEMPDEGLTYVGRGRYLIVTALPNVSPPVYLFAGVRPSSPVLPLWARIGLALAVTALVSGLLARLLTRRIGALRRAAAALAGGDLSARVQPQGRDEVAALAEEFNVMAERLQRLLASQRQLVSDVSHELRSPLARLRVALELAERDRNEHSLARIGKEADELERLVSDLLSLARLESGRQALEKTSVDLAALLREVARDADFEANAAGRRVTFEASAEAFVQGDRVLLRAAFENVIRNGIRHTPENTFVRVRLDRRADVARVSVRDAGPGVPEEAWTRLFEPFARIDEARDRDSGGYGLGLAITARALNAHGGRVSAANHPEGGLEVVMEIPLPGRRP